MTAPTIDTDAPRPGTLDEAIAALDAVLAEQEADGDLEPKFLDLGRAVIGTKQYEANRRLAKQAHQHLGPLAIMTEAEALAWYQGGKPKAWQSWLETYRADQKAAAVKEQLPVGLKGARRGGKADPPES